MRGLLSLLLELVGWVVVMIFVKVDFEFFVFFFFMDSFDSFDGVGNVGEVDKCVVFFM